VSRAFLAGEFGEPPGPLGEADRLPEPQIGGGAVSPVDPAVKVDGTPMASGYISIQAETAPADFRKIEVLNLEGCMDPKSPNYKTYFVKANPQACK